MCATIVQTTVIGNLPLNYLWIGNYQQCRNLGVFSVDKSLAWKKQLTFSYASTGFPTKWRLKNEHRYSTVMTCHYPDLDNASDWLKENFPCGMTNQKHYLELGSEMSSVWSFCARFSDVIWQGNLVVMSQNVSCFLRLINHFNPRGAKLWASIGKSFLDSCLYNQ